MICKPVINIISLLDMLDLHRIPLKGTHFVSNGEFPLAYGISDQSSPVDQVVDLLRVKAEQGFFNSVLKQHGAIILRLGNSDPDVISKYVSSIGVGCGDSIFHSLGYDEERTKVTDALRKREEGVNNTKILQRNECSRFVKYPTKIFLACTKANAEGGEISLAHGHEIFQRLQKKAPILVTELSKRGLYLEQTWNNEGPSHMVWSSKECFGKYIKDDDSMDERKRKAEKLVIEYISPYFRWDKNTNLIVEEHLKPLRVYENENKIYGVWFNDVCAICGGEEGEAFGRVSKVAYDDDKSPISEYNLDAILHCSLESEYNCQLQEGDILMVDNRQVSYGRNSWKNGEREILMSSWDTPGKPQFNEWVKPDNYIGTRDAPIDQC
ncbi:hypothetical protein FOA43_002564 [Brettanomyces nanus]|uniref:TauD/TfdA-like domain-containing protein n=1 Tax=Eeniella nana TaxID=13502 RepID=A0A875S7T4_EENNA|nr:uncharacterized protein FOA43_002564 [Brettanomyces nanus]QPG75214.1 hypothetical protein FOA43_002564 [Brettanomyces nanus]